MADPTTTISEKQIRELAKDLAAVVARHLGAEISREKATAKVPYGHEFGVDPARSYPMHEFLAMTGVTRRQIANMRREGVPLRDAGGSLWIDGSQWIEFIRTRPLQEPRARGRYAKPKS